MLLWEKNQRRHTTRSAGLILYRLLLLQEKNQHTVVFEMNFEWIAVEKVQTLLGFIVTLKLMSGNRINRVTFLKIQNAGFWRENTNFMTWAPRPNPVSTQSGIVSCPVNFFPFTIKNSTKKINQIKSILCNSTLCSQANCLRRVDHAAKMWINWCLAAIQIKMLSN